MVTLTDRHRGDSCRHCPITASITDFAIGPASAPPEMSFRATPASSIITATATFGSFAGAKEVNQANGGLSGDVCAVPVLPATWTPLIWAFWPVPFWTTSTIIWVNCDATCELTAWCSDSGFVSDTVLRSAVRTFCTRYG